MILNLPDDLEAYLREQIASGKFLSAEDVIRDALRLHQFDASPEIERNDLLRLIDEGTRSLEEHGSVELTREMLDGMLAKPTKEFV